MSTRAKAGSDPIFAVGMLVFILLLFVIAFGVGRGLERRLKGRFDPSQFSGPEEDLELDLGSIFSEASRSSEKKIPSFVSRIVFLGMILFGFWLVSTAIPADLRPPGSFMAHVPVFGGFAVGLAYLWFERRWVLQRTEREFFRLAAEQGKYPVREG